ncbi:MAG: hypothetical protein AAFZ07_25180 [Actinomycetota bacterium]
MAGRWAAWWRWIVRPWRSLGLVTALVASFAVPAFMAASADVFLVSASDSITSDILDDRPTGLDVTIIADGLLTEHAVDGVDQAMRAQLDRVGRLGPAERIVYADIELQRPSSDPDTPPETIIGSRARAFATDGALEALDVVDGDRSVEGVWLSERLSDRLDLPAGSLIAIGGVGPIPVAGVFADLWDGPRDPYWDELPAPFVPRFLRVLGGPSFESIVVPEALLLDLNLVGQVRWDSALADRPDTFDQLERHAARTSGIERAATESSELVGALAAFSGPGAPAPTVATEAADLRDEVRRIVDDLEQPIATAAIGGIVLGLLVTAAGAAFAVRKQETEVRLLRADGDAAWRFGARALLQYLAPAALGALVGVAAAWSIVIAPGGAQPASAAIDLTEIVRIAAIGLVVACAVTALAAQRVLGSGRSTVGSLRPAWFLPVVGIAVAAWIQVGAAGRSGEIDPLVIAFPLVGLIAGVGLVVVGMRWSMRRLRHRGTALPTGLFLAWRRITATDASAVLLSAALGIALGLIVFSTGLVAGLESASDAKAATAVGGRTQVTLNGRLDVELPERTTVVQVLATRSTIGDGRVTVLAIDPDSYADGVSWHPEFGSSAAEVVAMLEEPVDADVPAVAAGRLAAPREAGFGSVSVTSYAIVDAIDAAPLTSPVAPTLLVSAPAVEQVALDRHESQRPQDIEPEEWAFSYRSPLQRARAVIVSQLDEPELRTFIEDNDLPLGELETLGDRRDVVGNRAARWTFEYLGVLAAIAGLAAVGTLFFYLSEQRSRRELSTVMAERMGLRRRTAAVAAVGEVLGLVVVALLAGTSVGLVLAGRIFDRFEPDPRLPPDIGLEVSWPLVGLVALLAATLVVLAALVTQWAAGRRSYAEVLRGT